MEMQGETYDHSSSYDERSSERDLVVSQHTTSEDEEEDGGGCGGGGGRPYGESEDGNGSGGDFYPDGETIHGMLDFEPAAFLESIKQIDSRCALHTETQKSSSGKRSLLLGRSKGGKSKPVVYYAFELTAGEQTWYIFRRYSDFTQFMAELSSLTPGEWWNVFFFLTHSNRVVKCVVLFVCSALSFFLKIFFKAGSWISAVEFYFRHTTY